MKRRDLHSIVLVEKRRTCTSCYYLRKDEKNGSRTVLPNLYDSWLHCQTHKCRFCIAPIFRPILAFFSKEYMLPLRALDQIYGPHFQHRHGFEYILAIRDAAAQKQYFSTASVFNVPITLRWLVFAWNYKEEKKANGLVRASDLKIKAFFHLSTYLSSITNATQFF